VVEVDDVDRDRAPAKRAAGCEAALSGNQAAVGGNDDGMKEAHVADAGGERGDVAEVTASTGANTDRSDRTRGYSGGTTQPATR